MAQDMTDIINLLRREYLFYGLTLDELEEVARAFQRVEYDPGQVIMQQGEEGNDFFIVMNGKVRITRMEGGRERVLSELTRGEYFGEQSLLFDRPRNATVTAVDRTVLLSLNRDSFQDLLQRHPEMRMNLSATAESRYLARQERFDWLDKEEVIYLLTRKHDLFLFLSLSLPILIGVASVPVLVIGAIRMATDPTQAWMVVGGIAMLIISLLWAGWNWLDWANDFYMVTNQRVVWLERIFGLYDSRREAPLDTILSVNVTSSLIGRWLDYGEVSVRTYTGGIPMHKVTHPYLFAAFVEGYKQQAIAKSREAEAADMEKAISEALQRTRQVGGPLIVPPEPPKPLPLTPPKQKKRPVSLRERWRTLLKVRYERDGTITYRKHWWLLVRRAWQPVLALLAFFAGVALVLWLSLERGIVLFSLPVGLGTGLFVFLVLFLWFGYHFWDWSNDIYRLTPDQIHDINRKPLGQEIKKTANLENILSIEHERENLLGIIFNFGTVNIMVGETTFTFRGVYNPDQVHQDVSDFRAALNRRKQLKAMENDRNRMVNWLVTYYNEAEKLDGIENNADLDGFSG